MCALQTLHALGDSSTRQPVKNALWVRSRLGTRDWGSGNRDQDGGELVAEVLKCPPVTALREHDPEEE